MPGLMGEGRRMYRLVWLKNSLREGIGHRWEKTVKYTEFLSKGLRFLWIIFRRENL